MGRPPSTESASDEHWDTAAGTPRVTPEGRHLSRALTIAVCALACLPCAAATAGPEVAQRPPNAASGSPSWTPRRTIDGQPDLGGLWNSNAGWASVSVEAVRDPARTGGMGRGDTTLVVDPADGRIPYQPWARAKKEAILDNFLHPTADALDPQARDWPSGVPRNNYRNGLIQILQTRGSVVFLYENQHEFRVVTLDGRPPLDGSIKLWMGSSRGHWDGHTLVVDVANNTGIPWLSIAGDFHSDALRVTERWTIVGPDTIEHRATLTDPNVYTRPWTIAFTLNRDTVPGNQILETSGVEGERWVEHLPGAGAGSVTSGPPDRK